MHNGGPREPTQELIKAREYLSRMAVSPERESAPSKEPQLHLIKAGQGLPPEAHTSAPACPKTRLPDVYYYPTGKNYWRVDSNGRWFCVNEDSAKKYLISIGYNRKAPTEGALSMADTFLLRIQSEQNVDYVGPLAGYEAGPRQMNGRLVLVTNSPTLILPLEGKWPVTEKLLENMFVDGAMDQRPYIYGWLKHGLESYSKQHWSSSQVLALAGEVKSGKSLFQRLVTELFGGRTASPYQFLTKKSAFNGGLFYAEHLVVEDEAENIDYHSRRNFAAGIKAIAVNRDHSCHGKHKEALTLSPIWRMTISLNDDADRIQVLPPLCGDVADKILLVKVVKRPMPMPTHTAEQEQAFWDTLMAELPAFVDFLGKWEIPKEIQSERSRIKHFHHPELVDALRETALEFQLLEIIDSVLFPPIPDAHTILPPPVRGPRGEPWSGTSQELEVRLKDQPGTKEMASRLLPHTNSCGTLLGKLDRGGRVEKERKSNGYTVWKIHPPAAEVVRETVTQCSTFNHGEEKRGTAGGTFGTKEGGLVPPCPPEASVSTLPEVAGTAVGTEKCPVAPPRLPVAGSQPCPGLRSEPASVPHS